MDYNHKQSYNYNSSLNKNSNRIYQHRIYHNRKDRHKICFPMSNGYKVMEIERKFLVTEIPVALQQYKCRTIEQGYLSTTPVVRVRRDNDDYYLTYKGSGMMSREEYNLALTKESYEHLLKKADGNIITKKRYEIPNGSYIIELDIFEGLFEGTILAEVEFPTKEEALSYNPPFWFGEDVTNSGDYHNSNMSKRVFTPKCDTHE